jgi:hypothetical protein
MGCDAAVPEAQLDLPDTWGEARLILTVEKSDHRWTEYRENGKPVLELECPCKDSTELPQVCPAR